MLATDPWGIGTASGTILSESALNVTTCRRRTVTILFLNRKWNSFFTLLEFGVGMSRRLKIMSRWISRNSPFWTNWVSVDFWAWHYVKHTRCIRRLRIINILHTVLQVFQKKSGFSEVLQFLTNVLMRAGCWNGVWTLLLFSCSLGFCVRLWCTKKCIHEYGVVLNFSVHTIATVCYIIWFLRLFFWFRQNYDDIEIALVLSMTAS
jgi:hypothetical protein